jgi:hypothetical protein
MGLSSGEVVLTIYRHSLYSLLSTSVQAMHDKNEKLKAAGIKIKCAKCQVPQMQILLPMPQNPTKRKSTFESRCYPKENISTSPSQRLPPKYYLSAPGSRYPTVSRQQQRRFALGIRQQEHVPSFLRF